MYHLNQSDFWYFKFYLDKINSFYNQEQNGEKNINQTEYVTSHILN